MAVIERHPAVPDYVVEMSLGDIAARRGVADLFEDGKLILIKDYRLDFDFDALSVLAKSTESIPEPGLRRRLKKLTAPYFFKGTAPKEVGGRLQFADPLRQAIYDVLCRGERETFERAARALRHAHDEVLRIFDICFPNYETFRFIPSIRLTRTLFENLHWDNHLIDDDFHQARIFVNLDSRPRIWSVSHRFTDWVRDHYEQHELHRFAGKDPNLMIDFVARSILGGTVNAWMDNEPRHRIAFDPGEVWLGESRLISHQISYGEAAMVYMWFVAVSSMTSPLKRFNEQIEAIHREFQALANTA